MSISLKYRIDKNDLKQNKKPFDRINIKGEKGELLPVYISQLSPSVSEWNGDLEYWELVDDIIAIKELTINRKRAPNYIGFHFIVPSYQRGYRWDEEKVSDLLSDIFSNYEKSYKAIDPKYSAKTWYCLQPLVIRSANNFSNAYVVIDGQQRLTTLALILQALHNILPSTPRDFDASISLSFESRSKSTEYLYSVAEICKDSINIVLDNIKDYPDRLNRVKGSRKTIQEPKDIDSRYILNTYLFAYWYLYERICEGEASKNFFLFAEGEWERGESAAPKCIRFFENMLLEQTSVIWYNIENYSKEEDDHKVFENFNSGKIELTDSELVKGIFMNPDNYLEEINTEFNEKLKTRQIMIGSEWDEIEYRIHDQRLWDFIPHFSKTSGNDEYHGSRIGAILNIYIYFNLESGEIAKFDEDYWTYKKINNLINKELENLKQKKDYDTKTNRFDIMIGFWNEIKKIFHIFIEWYEGYQDLPNRNSLYHRISLLRRLEFRSSDNQLRRYMMDMALVRNIYLEFNKHPKNQRINILNKIIAEKLNIDGTAESITELIRAAKYSDSNTKNVEIILLAFNLSSLEKAEGYGGRFPFFTYKNESWEKEHIFATETVLSGEGEELLEIICSDEEVKSYKLYQKFLQKGSFDNITSDDDDIDFKDYEINIDLIKHILNSKDENRQQQIDDLMKEDGLVVNLFAENCMGNMALLPKKNNIIVSNKPFDIKSDKIIQMFKNSDFIPICTMNVFCNFYFNDIKDKISSRYWLYEKRLSYIMQMVESVSEYLEYKEVDANA